MRGIQVSYCGFGEFRILSTEGGLWAWGFLCFGFRALGRLVSGRRESRRSVVPRCSGFWGGGFRALLAGTSFLNPEP